MILKWLNPLVLNLKRKPKMRTTNFQCKFPKSLKKELTKSDNKYKLAKIERTRVLTIKGKIFIPTAIRQKLIAWYHNCLCRLGATRTEAMIRGTMIWPGLTRNVQSYCKNCKLSQFNKQTRKQYGKLPIKEAETKPWEIVQVDLVGAWKVKTPSGTQTLRCSTAIDPATSWP
jgi:hypothetical protein